MGIDSVLSFICKDVESPSSCVVVLKSNTLSWENVTVLHFGKFLAINLYEFVQSHLYVFI